MTELTESRSKTAPTKYGAVSYWLTVAILVLLAAVVITTGILGLMIRADARVALGNAKTVRMAFKISAIESYAAGEPFADAACESGVPEAIRNDIYAHSRAPGTFWLLQMTEDGTDVLRFVYQEGPFTVTYCGDPLSWDVDYQWNLIHALS